MVKSFAKLHVLVSLCTLRFRMLVAEQIDCCYKWLSCCITLQWDRFTPLDISTLTLSMLKPKQVSS